jgi:hypothetical protein
VRLRADRRLATALIVAVAALAAVAAALQLPRDPDPPPLRSGALPAGAFVDSIGVVTHLNYFDTAYARLPELLLRLRELGVRHIREAAPAREGPHADALRAVAAAGLRATVGVGDPGSDPAVWVADAIAVMGDRIAAFEAPNELDNTDYTNWPAQLRTYMPALAAAVRAQAPGVPVIGPSFIDPASRARIPADLPGWFNGHPYSGGEPPEGALDQALDERRATAPDRAAVFTEAGYHNALAATTGQPPTSEEAAAVYLPRLLVTAFAGGVRRTFVYELIDEKPETGLVDPEQHFGLLRNDLSPKPAFRAIKTLIDAVQASPGARRGEEPRWELDVPADERVERLVLARADGSRLIAVWRPVSVWDRDTRQPIDPGALDVELSFADPARDVAVWRPSLSPQPIAARPHVRRLPLRLEGDLVLVSFR